MPSGGVRSAGMACGPRKQAPSWTPGHRGLPDSACSSAAGPATALPRTQPQRCAPGPAQPLRTTHSRWLDAGASPECLLGLALHSQRNRLTQPVQPTHILRKINVLHKVFIRIEGSVPGPKDGKTQKPSRSRRGLVGHRCLLGREPGAGNPVSCDPAYAFAKL